LDLIFWPSFDIAQKVLKKPGYSDVEIALSALAHEFGHHKGLSGDPDPKRIMHDTGVPGRNEVTTAQCNAFKD